MAEHPDVTPELWDAFLVCHPLGPQEQAAFRRYLVRTALLPIMDMEDLEDEYLEFLETG